MAESTGTCAVCKGVYPIRVMRFNKRASDGQWEYQCSVCRELVKSGELER